MWPLIALAGANILGGQMKAAQQAKQRQAEAQMRAAEIEASPWTGRGPSTQVSTGPASAWGELAGSLVNTGQQYASLNNAGLFGKQGLEKDTLGMTPEAQDGVDYFNQDYNPQLAWTRMAGRKPTLFE